MITFNNYSLPVYKKMYFLSDMKSILHEKVKLAKHKQIDFFNQKNMQSIIAKLKVSLKEKNKFINTYNNEVKIFPKKVSQPYDQLSIFRSLPAANTRTLCWSPPPKRCIRQLIAGCKENYYINTIASYSTEQSSITRKAITLDILASPLAKPKEVESGIGTAKSSYELTQKKAFTEERRMKQKRNSCQMIFSDLKSQTFSMKKNTPEIKDENYYYNKIFDKNIRMIKYIRKTKNASPMQRKIAAAEETKIFAQKNYINKQIVELKERVHFMKGVIDFVYPKIMIQKVQIHKQPLAVECKSITYNGTKYPTMMTRTLPERMGHWKKQLREKNLTA